MRRRGDIIGGKKERYIGVLIGFFVHYYSKLLRFQIHSAPSIDFDSQTYIFTFWHNRTLVAPELFQRMTSSAKLTCLTSPSRDGTIIESMMALYGIESVRGSSSRRGKQAMIEMIKTLRSGSSLAITPDGPRGPRYKMDPGLIKLAAKTQTLVVPAQIEYSTYWELKTWDKFRIPKPFSTVTLKMHEPILLPKSLSDEGVLEMKAQFEGIMGE